MKKIFALFILSLCAVAAGCKTMNTGDEGVVIEDQPAAREAIAEGDELFDRGKFYKAYKAYERGLRLYPRYPRREEIVRREVEDIGLRFMDGSIKVGWFGTRFLARSRPEVGVDVIRKVVLKHHKQDYEFLSDAQYRLAVYLFDRRRYEEAQLEFQFLINNFKDSYWVLISEFLLAESFYRQNMGVRFDMGSLEGAQEHFRIFLDRSNVGLGSTEDERVEKARERLDTIRNLKAEKEYLKGEFYVEHGDYRAAALILRDIPVKYPETTWADKADILLAETQKKIDEER